MTQTLRIDGDAVRQLPVHTDLVHDEDGHRHLQGWVACARRGPIDLEECSSCLDCRGVLVKPHAGNAVLCAHAENRARPAGDRAVSWISRPAVVIGAEMAATDVADLMLEYEADPFLVVDAAEEAIGIIALRDVLRSAIAGELGARTASQLMRPLPQPIAEDASISDAALRLADDPARAIPLRDAAGRVTTLLTGLDVAEWAAGERRRG